jgi:hypothetical protein
MTAICVLRSLSSRPSSKQKSRTDKGPENRAFVRENRSIFQRPSYKKIEKSHITGFHFRTSHFFENQIYFKILAKLVSVCF